MTQEIGHLAPIKLPTHSIERVAFRFDCMLPESVWDASVLEGNPFTFPLVKTWLDGVTIGGRKISDQEQVLNLATSAKHLLVWVKALQSTPRIHGCRVVARHDNFVLLGSNLYSLYL